MAKLEAIHGEDEERPVVIGAGDSYKYISKKDLSKGLKTAEENLGSGKEYPALDFLQRVMDSPPSLWCKADDSGARKDLNFHAQALKLLREARKKFPSSEAGNQFGKHEDLSGKAAKRAYEEALAQNSVEALYEVAKRFRLTTAGGQALGRLIAKYAERGEFTLATLYIEALLQDEPLETISADKLFMYAVFARKAGNDDLKNRMVAEFKSRKKNAKLGEATVAPEKVDSFLETIEPGFSPFVNWSNADSSKRNQFVNALLFLGDRETFFKALGQGEEPKKDSLCDLLLLPYIKKGEVRPKGWETWQRNYAVRDLNRNKVMLSQIPEKDVQAFSRWKRLFDSENPLIIERASQAIFGISLELTPKELSELGAAILPSMRKRESSRAALTIALKLPPTSEIADVLFENSKSGPIRTSEGEEGKVAFLENQLWEKLGSVGAEKVIARLADPKEAAFAADVLIQRMEHEDTNKKYAEAIPGLVKVFENQGSLEGHIYSLMTYFSGLAEGEKAQELREMATLVVLKGLKSQSESDQGFALEALILYKKIPEVLDAEVLALGLAFDGKEPFTTRHRVESIMSRLSESSAQKLRAKLYPYGTVK